MTDEELSRKIAEFLGIKPKISWWASRDGGQSLAIEFRALDHGDYAESECQQWCRDHFGYEPVRKERWPSMVNDPAMTVMMMVRLEFFAFHGMGEDGHILACDNFAFANNQTAYKYSPTLGRAIAEAFAKANGLL